MLGPVGVWALAGDVALHCETLRTPTSPLDSKFAKPGAIFQSVAKTTTPLIKARCVHEVLSPTQHLQQ